MVNFELHNANWALSLEGSVQSQHMRCDMKFVWVNGTNPDQMIKWFILKEMYITPVGKTDGDLTLYTLNRIANGKMWKIFHFLSIDGKEAQLFHFFLRNSSPFILQGQYIYRKKYRDTNSQRISSHGIQLACPEYSSLGIWWCENLERIVFHKVFPKIQYPVSTKRVKAAAAML